MYTKIAPITINTEKKANGAAKIFIAEPEPAQEQLAGKLFILIEVEGKKSDANKIIDFVISDINENYYQNEKLMLREKIEALKIENIFETVLVKTNKNLIDFLSKEKITLSPKNISATIGIIFNNELHFSNIGTNQALLLYKEDTDSQYRMINVERNEESKEASSDNLNFKKLFSSIISGEMPTKSYFIFANEALSEYLFNQELIEIITKLAPLGAAEQIKNTLFKINSFIPFLGIIIKNNISAEEPESIEDYRQAEAARSLSSSRTEQKNQLEMTTEQKTENILAPTSVVNAKKMSSFCTQIFKAINPIKPLQRLFKSVCKPKERPATVAATALDRTALSTDIPKKTPKIKKILGIILILALLAFLINLIVQKTKTSQTKQAQETKSYGEVIKQKENQIDSYLLYNDEDSAKGVLAELKTYIDSLPADQKEKIEDYAELIAKYDSQTAQIMHVTKIEQLKTLVDFSAIGSDLSIENITIAGDKVYAADNSKKTIYRINIKDGVSAVVNSDQVKSYLKYPTVSKSGLITYLDEGQVAVLNPKDEKLSVSKMGIVEGQNLIGLFNYNDKLYALDKAKSQLYRYALTNNEYPSAEPRLKTKLDASDVNSFTIDNTGAANIIGTVYFLKSSGEVKKFYNGSEQKLTLDAVEPKLSNPTIIKVLTDIYILDPANKRLAVFEKNGKAKKQYQSDQLNNLKDFTINEKAKKAYLLTDNAVLELPL